MVSGCEKTLKPLWDRVEGGGGRGGRLLDR